MARFGFSSLGWPGIEAADCIARCADHGGEVVELRYGPEGTVRPDMSEMQFASIREAAATSGVEILTLATYVKVCDPKQNDEDFSAAASRAVEVASLLGASFVRVFPGGDFSVPEGLRDRLGRHRLGLLNRLGAEANIRIAIETHDSHPRGSDIVRLLDDPALQDVQVIWDALHPWRTGEHPETTARILHEKLAYLQVKEVSSPVQLDPLALGEGMVPLEQIALATRDLCAATCPVVFEYEAQWFASAKPLDEIADAARQTIVALFS